MFKVTAAHPCIYERTVPCKVSEEEEGGLWPALDGGAEDLAAAQARWAEVYPCSQHLWDTFGCSLLSDLRFPARLEWSKQLPTKCRFYKETFLFKSYWEIASSYWWESQIRSLQGVYNSNAHIIYRESPTKGSSLPPCHLKERTIWDADDHFCHLGNPRLTACQLTQVNFSDCY